MPIQLRPQDTPMPVTRTEWSPPASAPHQKWGAIGDLHMFGDWLEDHGQCMAWARAQALARGLRGFILPGDLFETDTIGSNSALPQYLIDTFFRNFYDPGLAYLIVSGNHDRKGLGRASAVKVFKKHPNFLVVDEGPRRVFLDADGTIEAFLVPWAFDYERELWLAHLEEMLQASRARLKILVAHCRVSGWTDSGGFTYTDEGPSFSIPKSLVERFDFAVLGDIHTRQEIIPGRGGYMGILTQTSFRDEDLECGMAELDLENLKQEWLPCPLARLYKTFVIETDEDLERVRKTVAAGSGQRPQRLKIRYRADGTESDLVRAAAIEKEFSSAILEPRKEFLRKSRSTTKLDCVTDPHAVLEFWTRVHQMDEVQHDSLRRELELIINEDGV